ncbi:hypothetical protein ACQEU3_40790 [Spirillospora sp. CA-253888]
MPDRPPLDQAVRDLRRDIAPDGVTTASQAWSSFLSFGRRRYDVPETPDGDGLLFQYGIVSFHGSEMFVLDFTRQFEVIDADGDHDHYVHVHCATRPMRRCGTWAASAPGSSMTVARTSTNGPRRWLTSKSGTFCIG